MQIYASMNETEMLNEIFVKVGKGYGHDSISAEFKGLKDTMVRSRRRDGHVELKVSDIFEGAPPEVMNGLANMIFSQLYRKKRGRYTKEILDWMMSDDFVRSKQPIFLKRSRNLTRSAAGEHIDLDDSYERLIDLGLVDRDGNIVISWTKRDNAKKIGYCSFFMRVVVISSILDSPDTPPFVIDYILYHELLHLRKGVDPLRRHHNKEFLDLEDLYPMRSRAVKWIEEHLKIKCNTRYDTEDVN